MICLFNSIKIMIFKIKLSDIMVFYFRCIYVSIVHLVLSWYNNSKAYHYCVWFIKKIWCSPVFCLMTTHPLPLLVYFPFSSPCFSTNPTGPFPSKSLHYLTQNKHQEQEKTPTPLILIYNKNKEAGGGLSGLQSKHGKPPKY